MSDLSVSIVSEPAATIVDVHGEIDMDNADVFGQELVAATDRARDRLVVDLSGVTYLDSAGVGRLFEIAARLADRSVAFAVVLPASSPLRKLFRIVRFDQVAAVVEDRAAALPSPPSEEVVTSATGASRPTRVVVVDTEADSRPRPPLVLDHQAVEVVAESDTADAAADLASRSQADAVVLRLEFEELRAADVLTSIQLAAPEARIVVLAGSGSGPPDRGHLGVLLRAMELHEQTEARSSVELDPDRGALRHARSVVAELCGRCGRPELVDDAAVVVTELVTNAIRHAGGPSQLRVLYGDEVLRLEVLDRSTAPLQPRQPDVGGPGGRGLLIVSALASAWGVDPLPAGKRVWAELAVVQESP